MRISRAMPLLLALAIGCGSDEPVEGPTPITDASPFEFPVELWDLGIEGETMLMIHVNLQGTVDSAVVEKSSGYAEFDSAAVAGARELRFIPGRKGEKRVAMWARLPVKFEKESATRMKAAPEAQP